MNKIYVGDTGTLVQVETGQDLRAAISVSLEVRKPSGAIVSWAATAVGTKLVYTSLVGTFDLPGPWKLQAKVELPSGSWLGETASFSVLAPFK